MFECNILHICSTVCLFRVLKCKKVLLFKVSASINKVDVKPVGKSPIVYVEKALD